MIEPHDRAGIRRPRTGALENLPDIVVGVSGRDHVAALVSTGHAIIVERAFRGFLIQDAVRMHAVRMRAVVSEGDLYRVADLCANDRAEHAEIGFIRAARFQTPERRVGVFAVDRLVIDVPDHVWPALQEELGVARRRHSGHSHHHVGAARHVVPVEFVSGDVVLADLPAAMRGGAVARRDEQQCGTQDSK